MRRVIESKEAPAAIGPYSQAVMDERHIWVSGQIGLDPRSGRLVEGGVQAQARQALQNLRAILHAAGAGMDQVMRVTVYLVEMADFAAVNEVYAGFFGERPPARACVAVCRLPKDAAVEIDAVARVS